MSKMIIASEILFIDDNSESSLKSKSSKVIIKPFSNPLIELEYEDNSLSLLFENVESEILSIS